MTATLLFRLTHSGNVKIAPIRHGLLLVLSSQSGSLFANRCHLLCLIDSLNEHYYSFHQTSSRAQLPILLLAGSRSFAVPITGFDIAIPQNTACAELRSAR